MRGIIVKKSDVMPLGELLFYNEFLSVADIDAGSERPVTFNTEYIEYSVIFLTVIGSDGVE